MERVRVVISVTRNYNEPQAGSVSLEMDPTLFAGPFHRYSEYLTRRYGEKTYRVSVDAGFSCPNRRSDPDGRGCSYCADDGSRAAYVKAGTDMDTQITRAVRFLERRYGARQFLLYFQAYTNTDADMADLASIYGRSLSLFPFRELIVSTRPDAISGEKADLLASYRNEEREVWVELGLQSANEATLAAIDRGHTVADFERAYRMLRRRGVRLSVHLIFGLPGEGWSEVMRTVEYVASLAPDGVKIHNLVIPRSARLYEQYLQGEMAEYGYRRHLEYTMGALERLPPATVIMRLTCDMHSSRPGIPRRRWNKATVYQDIERIMKERGRRQGSHAKEVSHADQR